MSDKISLYNILEIPLNRMNRESQIELLKDFFKKGIEWCNIEWRNRKYIYFYGIDAETDLNVWESIEREVLTFAQKADGFYFIVGPVILVEKKNGEKIHPLLEVLKNKKKFKNVKIFECDARARYHYMLLLASLASNGQSEVKEGLLIVEKPHPIMSSSYREKMLLELNKDYDFATKEEIGRLFAEVLQELKDETLLTREIKNYNEMIALTEEEFEKLIEEIKKREIEFNSVTTREIRKLLSQITFSY
jgi:hypothetical protein